MYKIEIKDKKKYIETFRGKFNSFASAISENQKLIGRGSTFKFKQKMFDKYTCKGIEQIDIMRELDKYEIKYKIIEGEL